MDAEHHYNHTNRQKHAAEKESNVHVGFLLTSKVGALKKESRGHPPLPHRAENGDRAEFFRNLTRAYDSLRGSEIARQVARKQEHKQYQQHQANAAAGVVAPIAAVAPPGQRTYKQQDDDNEKDQSHMEFLSS
jgi:hypothetical protein